LTLGRAVLEGDILALDIASLLHALVERGHPVKRREWVVSEKPNHRHRLLRARRERPRGSAAERG
jgi:molybdopterin-biosynthesis enzyme MoeA-like protein